MSNINAGAAKPHEENPNISWATLFVNELARGGLAAVCLAPGSRSTPLAFAFYACPNIRIYQHLDERSAGFFALGMAMATQKPVALLCTSGTAAANFHPAIIEAQMSQIPLLVLTADRPHELRHSGANQTIDQIKMFGDHVLWSVDVALPTADAPQNAVRNLRTLAARALARSDGFTKGPVHINFPFRKPLEPRNSMAWAAAGEPVEMQLPHTRIERGHIQPTNLQLATLAKLIDDHPRGLIICGPRCPAGDFPDEAIRLSRIAGYPLLADPLSGVRFGCPDNLGAIIGGYETFLQAGLSTWPKPDLILRFGMVPTSKWANSFMENGQPSFHIHIRESGKWADQDHTTNYFIQADPTLLCQRLAALISGPADDSWPERWSTIEKVTWRIINDHLSRSLFDGSLVAALLEQLPPDARLFVGNSLAIRHVDQFGQPRSKPMQLFANRGASGIDGNISTGLGVAAASHGLTVLLIGDVTFFHDSNGLLALKQMDQGKVIIVLLNNNGGGIFRRLPVAQFEPPFKDLFLTPHDLNFASLAALHGLDYHLAQDLSSFKSSFEAALSTRSASVVEIQTDSQSDDQRRRNIIAEVAANLPPR